MKPKEFDVGYKKLATKLLRLCRKNGVKGNHTSIDGYYVMFSFEPEKKRCSKCNQIIE